MEVDDNAVLLAYQGAMESHLDSALFWWALPLRRPWRSWSRCP